MKICAFKTFRENFTHSKLLKFFLFTIFISLPLNAYIGPGAGFALISSFMATFIAIISVLFAILILPFKIILRKIKKRKPEEKSIFNRIVLIGLDGLDPDITKRFLRQDKLPNIKNLINNGTFKELNTTNPAVSPVAWSTFQTGTNPGKHKIFGFLKRTPGSYSIDSSESALKKPEKKLSIGKLNIPIGKPLIKSNRKSKSFWKILGEYGIFSSIINLPGTFPPPELYGVCLSGLGTPDLKGTQGEFTLYAEDWKKFKKPRGGTIQKVNKKKENITSFITGPPSPFRKDEKPLKIKFRVKNIKDSPVMYVNRKKIRLQKNRYTDWVELNFRVFPGINIKGICKFMLLSINPFHLYQTPVNISPEKPSLPISYPSLFSRYMFLKNGNYPTLGFAEDTWALVEEIIPENKFTEQCYRNYYQRKKIFSDILKKSGKGVFTMVFDIPDRIQHIFINNESRIEELYKNMDELVGELSSHIDKKTLLLIISDHGFKEFKWEFNINAWLKKQDFLKVIDNKDEIGPYFKGVNWKTTRAYSYDYCGIFLNRKNREPGGIVKDSEKNEIINDIGEKLKRVKNPYNDEYVFKNIYRKEEIYEGPYIDEAPDILIGYNPGYRTSWSSVIGDLSDSSIFSKNTEKWSGDHSYDPPDVPGVLISNKIVDKENASLKDIAPTILNCMGIKIPPFMDGQSLIDIKND